MKPQQRNFIVEVKSARRRSIVKPTSIWGDTDLKSLVREAEVAAPHLFEPAQQANKLSTSANAGAGPDDNVDASAMIPDHVVVVGERQVGGADSPIPAPEAPSATKISTTALRPRRKKNGIRQAVVSPIIAVEAEPNELNALENENRSLKALLVRRLQEENVLLRGLLERFGTR